ncbi:MAG TPA: hypothetical protein VLJ42_06895 [Solirubrobacteraceae bacterium]|nr:hypothetical protein [Solirubrobacteraceae bacterium]
MAIATDSRRPEGGRAQRSLYRLGGAMLAVGVLVLAGVLTLGSGADKHRSGPAKARATANKTPVRTQAAVQPADGVRGVAHQKSDGAARARTHGRARARSTMTFKHSTSAEVADPEEAKSFPAPASVHHKAASAPRKAAELAVAPGAPSDAEIRHELAQMHAVQRAQQQHALAAAAGGGGGSVGGNGTIQPGAGVPAVIAKVVAGGNAIADFPYVFGGGHASFVDNAYDCSGSVSYALAAGGMLSAPETSGTLESWGASGPGKWITVYANAGHTYMYVNTGGTWMRFDTSGRSGVFGSRWQPGVRSNAGFVARHYPGL